MGTPQKGVFFVSKTMAKKKAQPLAPVYKVKPIKAKKFGVKVPKLPKFRSSKFKF